MIAAGIPRIGRRPRRGFALIAVLGMIVFVSAMLAVILGSLTTQLNELSRRAETLPQHHAMRAAAERAWSRYTMDPDDTITVWTPDPNFAGELHAAIKDDQRVEVVLKPTNPISVIRTQIFRIEEGHAIPF
ncbi:MAG: hypothetical protein AAGF97_08870 [Planctomycetota bacterium]